jgi:lipoate-protein ligase A
MTPETALDTEVTVVDEGVYSEPMHHALDHVILDRVDAGEITPVLRFWYRETPAVPLGRFQAYEDEVATEYVESRDVAVVRRVTGGGAMFVEPGNVITYSMYLPTSVVPSDVAESYERLDEWAIAGLRNVGLDVEHEPLNDIVHADGKIGGSAQLRRRDAVLHHTTMSYDLDIEAMLSALRIGEQKISDKAVKSAEKRVARIEDHVDADRETVVESLKTAFVDVYGGEMGSLDEETLGRARDLAKTRFDTDDWNRRL